MNRRNRATALYNPNKKLCPGCSRKVHSAFRICPSCDHEFYAKRVQVPSAKQCPSCARKVHTAKHRCACDHVFYDMQAHNGGVNRRGQNNGASKLTPGDVRYIRANARLFDNIKTVAKQFDVRPETVRAILRGEIWGWLK